MGFVWVVVRLKKQLFPIDFTNWRKDSEFVTVIGFSLRYFIDDGPLYQGISCLNAMLERHFGLKRAMEGHGPLGWGACDGKCQGFTGRVWAFGQGQPNEITAEPGLGRPVPGSQSIQDSPLA